MKILLETGTGFAFNFELELEESGIENVRCNKRIAEEYEIKPHCMISRINFQGYKSLRITKAISFMIPVLQLCGTVVNKVHRNL